MFFDFEKLDVYQVALDFVRDGDIVARGRDQLLRIVFMLTSLTRSISEKSPNLR